MLAKNNPNIGLVQWIFTNDNIFSSRIFTNFKPGCHEFSNYDFS